MSYGKLDPATLEKDIFPRTGVRRPETVLRPGVGEDCAALDLSGDLTVLSTDPITGADADSGYLSVVVSVNDVLSNGADPVGILLTILLAEDEGPDKARAIMESAHRAAKDHDVEIVGGHTEVTPGLTQTILSVTAIGRAPRARLLRADGVREGDALVLTKGAGIEGTAILCADAAAQLEERMDPELVRQGRAMLDWISIRREALAARPYDVHAMHDVTEGGVLGACHEMAAAAGLGLLVDQDAIVVPAPTRALCRTLAIDPLRLISSGALLIATGTPEALLAALEREGVPAACIGRFRRGDMELLHAGRAAPLPPPRGDELWVARKRIQAWKQDDS